MFVLWVLGIVAVVVGAYPVLRWAGMYISYAIRDKKHFAGLYCIQKNAMAKFFRAGGSCNAPR